MSRGSRQRARHRSRDAEKAGSLAAQNRRKRFIAEWGDVYAQRAQTSLEQAELFRRLKEAELRQLGATDAELRTFANSCTASLFALGDRRFRSLNVPTRLVANYEAVESFGLREARRR